MHATHTMLGQAAKQSRLQTSYRLTSCPSFACTVPRQPKSTVILAVGAAPPSRLHNVHHDQRVQAQQPTTPTPPSSQATAGTWIADNCNHLRTLAISALCSWTLLLSAVPALADSNTISFPASKDPEIRAAQSLLVETWAYVNGLYLDTTFNNNDWNQLLQDALAKTFTAKTKEEALLQVNALLKPLGDPFTRVLLPSVAQIFEAEIDGKVIATGITVDADAGGHVRITYVGHKSPAEAAGLVVGDQLVEVNGQKITAANLSKLKPLLNKGVNLTLLRSSPQASSSTVPSSAPQSAPLLAANTSVASSSPTSSQAPAQILKVYLSPKAVEYRPVQYGLIDRGQAKTAYIRIITFSNGVGEQVQVALNELQSQGAQSLILDLRDNPGGVVGAGVEVAQLLLQPGDVLCNVRDRNGNEETVRLDTAIGAAGQVPMAVLVNGESASTSELLAGALHDDLGATLIGEKTFGKGRTQRIIKLSNGATLLVSTVSYTSPLHIQIDRRGLQPDVACKPDVVAKELWEAGELDNANLLEDPCIKIAYEQVGRPAPMAAT